jgi:hypothetical protein
MRSTLLLPVTLAAVLLAPAAASAQPTLYVCTPTAQVLTVDGTSGATGVLYTGAGSFHDCVLGPDGWLYIANDTNIVRVNATTGSPSPAPLNSSPLPSAARGLAFNVTTLYINTASSGVYKLVGRAPTIDGDPLRFPDPVAQAFPLTTSGQGLAFGVKGDMAVASDSSLLNSPFPYGGTSTLIGSGIQPFGVAVNTCKEIVFADAATNTVRRRTPTGSEAITGLAFGTKDIPRYLEIDSANTLYVVTAENLTAPNAASNAKIWRASFPFATNQGGCSSATKTLLVELKSKLSGPGKLVGLLSDRAMGIAVAATDYFLDQTFNSAACSKDYDFGYHSVNFTFDDCAAAFPGTASATIRIEALKSTLSQVNFDPSVFTATPMEGMRYSAMGGFPVQYRLGVVSGTNPFPTTFRAIYHFHTNERVATPGVARYHDANPAPDPRDAVFNENVGDDYWEAGSPAGETADDISKRVVFSAGLTQACTLAFGEPLQTQNPLFNGVQSIPINVTATNAQNQNCSGGALRVSLFRYTGASNCDAVASATGVEFLTVSSVGGAQQENIMDPAGPGKYKYNLDSAGLETGAYLLTFWGNIAEPTTKCFAYSK